MQGGGFLHFQGSGECSLRHTSFPLLIYVSHIECWSECGENPQGS